MMKNKLFLNNKIEIRKSNIHGYGVFANAYIGEGELIEECHYAKIEPPINGTIDAYHYGWPKIKEGTKITIDPDTLQELHPELKYKIDNNIPFSQRTIVFGFGSMYNSSETKTTCNVNWYNDLINDIFVFEAIKDIEKDEELCIHYSPELRTLANKE